MSVLLREFAKMQAQLRGLMNVQVVPALGQQPPFLVPASTLSVATDEDAAIAAIDGARWSVPISRRDLPSFPVKMPSLDVSTADCIIATKSSLTSCHSTITLPGYSDTCGTLEVLYALQQSSDISVSLKRAVVGLTVGRAAMRVDDRVPAMFRDDELWSEFLDSFDEAHPVEQRKHISALTKVLTVTPRVAQQPPTVHIGSIKEADQLFRAQRCPLPLSESQLVMLAIPMLRLGSVHLSQLRADLTNWI